MPVLAATAETDALQRLSHPRSNEAQRKPENLEDDRYVLEDAPGTHELEVLKDDPEVAAQKRNGIVA
jgi:hypothetical protein